MDKCKAKTRIAEGASGIECEETELDKAEVIKYLLGGLKYSRGVLRILR